MKSFEINYSIFYFIAKVIRLFYNPYNVLIPTGFCPVKAEGFLSTGEWYYFRSRLNSCILSLAKSEKHWMDGDLIFEDERFFKNEFVGGWISPLRAYFLLNFLLRKFYKKDKYGY